MFWLTEPAISEGAEASWDRFLRSKLELLESAARPTLEGEARTALEKTFAGMDDNVARYTVIAADGTVLADTHESPSVMENHAHRPEILEATKEGLGGARRFSTTLSQELRYRVRRVDRADGTPLGFVRAAIAESAVNKQRDSLRAALLRGLAIALGVGLAISWFLSRRIARPVRDLTQTAVRIAEGELALEPAPAGSDEIGQLATAFRQMGATLRERLEQLEAERRELAGILRSMVEGVIAVDDEQRTVLMNDAAGRILALDPDGVAGRPFHEGIPVRPVAQLLARTLESQTPGESEVQLPGAPHDVVIQVQAAPLRRQDGESAGAVIVLHDITDLRRLEVVRRDFVANASHELKTPVAAIRGLVETILDDREMPEATQRSFMDRIQAQAFRLGELVEELLALSRLEAAPQPAGRGDPHDLRVAIRQAVESTAPLAREVQATIALDLPDQPTLVNGTPEALLRITGNILENAVKFTREGTNVDVTLVEQGGRIVLDVADRGPGIPPAERARVFERFYRVDRGRSRDLGGTGLGLAIVKHLVLGLGGEITISDGPEGGTTVRVEFPVGTPRE